MGVRSVVGVLRRGVGRGAARLRGIPRTHLTVGAAGIALVATVPFGGLRQSYEETHPAVAATVDQVLHADPFDVTITGASVVDVLRSYRSDGTESSVLTPAEGNSLLILRATVLNASDAAVDDILLDVAPLISGEPLSRDAVFYARLGDDAEIADSTVLSADDASWISTVNPSVPYHLAIAIEFSGPLPTSVDLGVARLSYDFDAIALGVRRWQHPEPAYQLTVPVVDKRGDKQRPEGWVPAEEGEG
ncbi:hypothetical protein [Nocardioides sp.]|uniref:hypothetical protein n=1 Tax=Nocardioides sp. TaxID=35761 RepID=UPI0039E38169